MKRFVLALAAIGLLGGCGVLKDRRPTTPTVGTRVPVLGANASLEPDPTLADMPVAVPGPVANPDWPQPGGNISKTMTHVALGESPQRLWSVGIGSGNSFRTRLVSEPMVGGGRVYTIDTLARVRAFNADTGATVWTHELRGENVAGDSLFGGGVTFDGGRVYATSGNGEVAALDAATGNKLWQVKPGGPLRGAPTVAAGTVYVLSQDSQLYALDASNGANRWTGAGTFELAGVFGSAAPAFAQSTLVAGFASGELTAYRYENGNVVWQDALARTGISTVVGTLSDIDADPVIDNGRVFAIGQGGRMVAIELITGQRAWELNVSGLSTPWVAGEWVFVVSDRAQLMAVSRASGKIRWLSQLPRYRVPERRGEPDRRTGAVRVRQGEDPIFWRGPVLAGNRLVLTSSRGQIVYASPVDGRVLATVDAGESFSLPPVVANNTLYVLADDGRLTAYR